MGGSVVENKGLTRLQHLAFHFLGWAQHMFWVDLITWPIWKLDPDGIGGIRGGDVDVVAVAVSLSYGLPVWFVKTLLLAAPGFIVYHGLAFQFHFFAMISITLGGSGDDWPTFFRSPWKATSIMEFWQRWHHVSVIVWYLLITRCTR